MLNSNVQANIDRIKEILETQPATTHIYFRREDDRRVDIPAGQAIFTAKNNPNWAVEEGAFPQIELAVTKAEELPVIPPKPSEEVQLPVQPLAPVQPPQDNAHVAPGAEQFPESKPTESKSQARRKAVQKKGK